MRWLGVETQVFSVGNYRRALLGSMPSSWFDPTNRDAKTKRIEIANECLEDLISWITKDGGQVAVYDANSESAERRKYIFDRLTEMQIQPIFIGKYIHVVMLSVSSGH
jgi:6-phosphofructo-2-kinase/fructose-2,6-biphosphatase 4